jgi:hypothetical protein
MYYLKSWLTTNLSLWLSITLNTDMGLGIYAPVIKFSTLLWFMWPYSRSGRNFVWEKSSACIKRWVVCTSEPLLYTGKWTNPCTCQTSNHGQLYSWLRNLNKLIPLLWARQSKVVANRRCNYVAPDRGRRSVHRRRLIKLSTDEIRMVFGNDGAGQKSGLWMLIKIFLILGSKRRWAEFHLCLVGSTWNFYSCCVLCGSIKIR